MVRIPEIKMRVSLRSIDWIQRRGSGFNRVYSAFGGVEPLYRVVTVDETKPASRAPASFERDTDRVLILGLVFRSKAKSKFNRNKNNEMNKHRSEAGDPG